MSDFDRFSRLLQGRAPIPQANITRQYQTPQGITPPMALPRPTPPQSPMLANQQLSPLMQQVLRNAQASRLTPKPGQVALPTPATAAAGKPAPEMTLGQRLMQPRTQGMLGAAAAGFEASGYQDRPVSLGQVLGRMGTAGTKAYTAAEDRIAKQKAAGQKSIIDRLLAEAQYAKATKGEKPVLKMIPTEDGSGSTQLTMLDPYTGETLGTVGGVKPPSGMSLSMDADGNLTLTQGTGANLQKGTIKDLEKDIRTLTGQISMLDQAAATFDPELLTYGAELESFFGSKLAKINPSMLSDDQRDRLGRRTQFIRGVQQTFSTLLNELSGAAVSNFELGNARKYSVNPNDDPISFEAKLRDQRGFANAALFRSQAILGGEPITTNLAKKYPISITGKNSQGEIKTLYMHEFVEKYMDQNDVDQATALSAYAEAAKK